VLAFIPLYSGCLIVIALYTVLRRITVCINRGYRWSVAVDGRRKLERRQFNENYMVGRLHAGCRAAKNIDAIKRGGQADVTSLVGWWRHMCARCPFLMTT